MLYDLVVYKNELDDEYIDIKGFENDSTLQGIINFTTSFENHNALMKTLCEEGYIPLTYINGVFRIHWRRGIKSEAKLMPYGLAYNTESKFFSIPFLINYFVQNMNSIEFMDAFIAKYYNYLKSNPIIIQELNYINFCHVYYKQFGKHYNEEHIESTTRERAMRSFVEKYTHKINSKKQIIENPRAIRDLAMFAINYERNKNNYNPEDATITIDDLKSDTPEIKNELRHYRILISTLSTDDEQYSFYESKIKELEDKLEMKLVRS